MANVQRGKVAAGGIVFSQPLPLAEGTEVLVHIEPLEQLSLHAEAGTEFASLPFFGMWADRTGLEESADLVRKEREKWHQRAGRQD